MKPLTKHIGWVLLASIAISALLTTLEVSQGNPNKALPEAIVIQFRPTMGPFTTNQYGISRPVIGLEVEWASPSAGAPQIPPGLQAGETIAYLAGYGFKWQLIGVNLFVFEK